MAFMPFITAGDPDIATTLELIKRLTEQQVDLIEIGFPYSDPIADGPVIQASYTRALNNKTQVDDIFSSIASLKQADLPALVAMVSYAIIFRYGPAEFLTKAKQVGFSGLIIPDLPGDEAAEFFVATRQHELDLIQLVAPTTPPERLDRILKSASGFLYCIAVAGITGTRDELPAHLDDYLTRLRSKTDLPLAVGFGISQQEHVQALRGKTEGVIVGSAIVRHFDAFHDGNTDRTAVINSIADFTGGLLKAVKNQT